VSHLRHRVRESSACYFRIALENDIEYGNSRVTEQFHTPLSATRWTATVTATADTTLSYKYDLGGSWSSVEETAGCGYVGNRSMSVNGGAESDTVANWQGLGGC
jgi:hypothetical protein